MNKKTDKANLEKKKILFFQIGFILALSLALFVLEYKQPETKIIRNEVFIGEPEFITELIYSETKIEAPTPKATTANGIKEVNNNTKTSSITISAEVIDYNTEKVSRTEKLNNKVKETYIAEVQAKFPGGEKALNEYLKNNMHYPAEALKKKIQGRVYVNFAVEKDGTVSDIKIINSSNKLLNKEALRLISNMPKWKPSEYNSEPVLTRSMVSIIFKL